MSSGVLIGALKCLLLLRPSSKAAATAKALLSPTPFMFIRFLTISFTSELSSTSIIFSDIVSIGTCFVPEPRMSITNSSSKGYDIPNFNDFSRISGLSKLIVFIYINLD